MTDPKTLREIADKTCIFDRAHFDDGNVPEPDVFIRHHESLKTDRKLITRLVPRFAVALGYFEGYASALSRWGTLNGKPFFDGILEMLEARPGEGIVPAIERNRKERADERRAIRTALGSSSDVVGSLAADVAAVVGERDELRSNPSRDFVLMELSRARERIASMSAFANATEVRDNAAQLVQNSIDRLLSNGQQNIGIVKKPPPPPPAAPPKPNEQCAEIDDELAQAATEYANMQDEGLGFKGNECVRDAIAFKRSMRSPWADSAVDFVNGARWQYVREKALSAQLREYEVRIDETEKERLAMKEERDRALAKVRAWEERTGETQPRIVEAKLEMPTDEEIVRFVAKNIYKDRTGPTEVERSSAKLAEDPEGIRRTILGRGGSLAEACAIKLAFLHFSSFNRVANEYTNAERTQYEMTIEQQRVRIVELEKEVGSCKETIETTAVQAAEWRDRAERCDAIVNSSEPQPFVVFRDESERDFWDEQVYVLNRSGDRSARDVASVADEMVEERRKRMPLRIVSETEVRPAIVGVRETNKNKEITDELLLRAAIYANRELNFSNSSNDLNIAKNAMSHDLDDTKWGYIVRAYVASALGKT